jgi:hypothetical protein
LTRAKLRLEHDDYEARAGGRRSHEALVSHVADGVSHRLARRPVVTVDVSNGESDCGERLVLGEVHDIESDRLDVDRARKD